MARNKRNQGNENIPFKRDQNGQILFSDKHRAYVKDILDPSIRFIEAEGAVRAGKDVYGLAAYAKVLDMHDNQYHLALATTIGMAEMLILDADGFGIMHHFPNGYIGQVKDKTAFLFADSKGRDKALIVAGGMNENAEKTIRGLNYGTVYANESNLLHIKSLEEAKRRIMASTMPKFICTQNPGAPASDYYDKFEKPLQDKTGNPKFDNDNPNNVRNGIDFRYHHFLQYDNPALTIKQIEVNKRSFASETDLQRNFYGVRIASEGVIYDMITSENYYKDDDGTLTDYMKYTYDRIILIDVGTTNPQVYVDTFISNREDKDPFTCYFDREYRWDSLEQGRQKDDTEYAADLVKFIQDQCDGAYSYVIVDPAAASFKAAMRTAGIVFIDADNTVMGTKTGEDDNQKKAAQGIKLVQIGWKRNKLKVNRDRNIEGTKELLSYQWDAKARERGIEQPLKSRDHWPDCIRYGVNTHIKYSSIWDVMGDPSEE